MENIINLTKMSFLNLKSIFKQIWFICAIWLAVSIFNPVFLNMMFGMTVIMTIYQVMAYEDSYGIDNLISVMPVKKNEYVISRYLMGTISIFIAIILIVAIYFVSLKFNIDNIPLQILLSTGITMAIIAMSVVIPIVLKYGINKGRMISMLITMLLMMAPSFAIGYIAENPHIMENIMNVVDNIGMPLIATIFNILVLSVSMVISIKVYERKEVK